MRLSLAVAILGLAAASAAFAEIDTPPDAATILTGTLLPEGTASDDPASFVIKDIGHFVAFDLGAPRRIRAILLQADGNDVYFVEVSNDDRSWQTIWRAPRYGGLPGLRTRTTVLSAAVEARFVRVRPTYGDGAFSVARLRIYENLPSPWPPPSTSLARGFPSFPP